MPWIMNIERTVMAKTPERLTQAVTGEFGNPVGPTPPPVAFFRTSDRPTLKRSFSAHVEKTESI
ncbi:MAG: hypothetical protein K0M67_23875 [Thiobacillus sp.]|nr:hypothetical protein [Thiobacillus sp.]